MTATPSFHLSSCGRILARLSLATLLLALALFIAGCGDSDADAAPAEQEQQEVIEVDVAPVEAVSVPQFVEVTGTVEADARTTIASQVTGRVVEIFADLGDRLGPGEPLAQIDPSDYELAVAQREAALYEALAALGLDELPGEDFDLTTVVTVERSRLQAANAEARLRRAATLFDQTPPLISEQEYADLQTTADVAQRDYDVALLEARAELAAARTRASELAIARRDLENTLVRTPAGDENATYAVARRYVTVGQLVENGTAMFEVVVDDPLRFTGAVPERFSGDVALGQRVLLNVASTSGPVEAEISRLDPTVDASSRTFLVEVTVDNAERRLRPGAFARGQVQIGTTPAFAVPTEAIVTFAGTDKVYVVRDGQAVEQRVTVLQRGQEQVVVNGDLAAEDQVVTRNAGRLSNGTPVAIEASAAPTEAP